MVRFVLEHQMDEDILTTNKLSADNFTTTMVSSTNRSFSSSIEKLFSFKHTSSSKFNYSKQSENKSNFSSLITTTEILPVTTSTSRKTSQTTSSILPYALANYLVDQFNKYRDIDIISRIKQCDSKMQLHDMCEAYSIDNHSYSLVRESSVEFHSLKHLYDALIDRMTVHKLSQLCPIDQWCLANLTHDDFRFTLDILQKRGRSLCTLDKCTHRLFIHTTSCPSISPKVNPRLQ